MLLYIFRFFTVWVFLLTVFHEITHNYLSLPFLTFVAMMKGLYFSYVNPKKYVIQLDNNKKYVIDGHQKLFVDLVLHIGVFCFAYYKYGIDPIWDEKILASLVLIAVYHMIYNAPQVYGIPFKEIAITLTYVIIIYIIVGVTLGVY